MRAVVGAAHNTEHGEPKPILVPLKFDSDAHELLVELMQRTGWDASELVSQALGAFWRELEGIVLPPPEPQKDFEQVLREAEEHIRAGRTYSHEEVMAEAREIVGG